MAYCDFCHKGIGPERYEFLVHENALFGGHPECMVSLKKRLEEQANKKNSKKGKGEDN